MSMTTALVVMVGLAGLAGGDGAPNGPAYVDVTARFQRTKAGEEVAVTFAPRDVADIRVNQKPAPRLKLDAAQKVLVEKPAGRSSGGDEGKDQYLDTTWPVVFPVRVASGAPRGSHEIAATVTYYYCSKKAGWCRKGTAELAVPVTVP